MLWKRFLAFSLVFSLLSCVPPPSKESFRKEEPPALRGEKDIYPLTDDGDKKSLLAAIDKSLEFVEGKMAGGNSVRPPASFGSFFTAENIQRTLKLFRDIYSVSSGPSELEERISEKFAFIGRSEEDAGPP